MVRFDDGARRPCFLTMPSARRGRLSVRPPRRTRKRKEGDRCTHNAGSRWSRCAPCWGTVGIAGCAPQATRRLQRTIGKPRKRRSGTTPTNRNTIIAGEEGTTYDGISLDAYPGKGYLDDMHDMWDANVDQWAPELRTLPSGQIVQRTPSELTERARQGKTPYNIYRLNNDNRGCNSCHADLDATLQHLAQTMHPSPNSPALDAEMTVDQCLFCHTYSPGYIPTQYEVRHAHPQHPLRLGGRRSVSRTSTREIATPATTPPTMARAWRCGTRPSSSACAA